MGKTNRTSEPRCFLVLTNDSGSSVKLVYELYSSKHPRTIANFLKLCTGDNEFKLSYKRSTITRIISPEFLIQGGLIRRKNADTHATSLKQVVDHEEYQSGATNNNEKLLAGDLCLVDDCRTDGSDDIPDVSKCEFFIPLRNLSKYPNLTNRYLVIGRLVNSKETLESLIDWSIDIPVDDEGYPLTSTYIERVGQLIPTASVTSKDQTQGDVDSPEGSTDDKVNLFDAIFGSRSGKSKSSHHGSSSSNKRKRTKV